MIGETGTIEIPVMNDEPLIVVYKRGKRSPRENVRILTAQRKLNEASADGTPDPEMFSVMVGMLADSVVSWNLTDDDGAPIGTDPESLMDVDLDILTAIAGEIGRQSNIDPLSKSGSNNGSTPEADLEPRRIGSASS
jgi:hypothetical protein